MGYAVLLEQRQQVRAVELNLGLSVGWEDKNRTHNSESEGHKSRWKHIVCSFYKLIKRPEHLIGRQLVSPGKLKVIHSVIT
jgi:hypothetical protein